MFFLGVGRFSFQASCKCEPTALLRHLAPSRPAGVRKSSSRTSCCCACAGSWTCGRPPRMLGGRRQNLVARLAVHFGKEVLGSLAWQAKLQLAEAHARAPEFQARHAPAFLFLLLWGVACLLTRVSVSSRQGSLYRTFSTSICCRICEISPMIGLDGLFARWLWVKTNGIILG